MQLYKPLPVGAPPVTSSPRFLRRPTIPARGKKAGYLAWYFKLHCICFFLYAVAGKGFAYVGLSPVFVGEVLLLGGLFVAFRTGKLTHLAQKPLGLLLLVFSLWELGCTLPYADIYGVDAFRDAVLWAYSIFAWIVATVVLRFDQTIGLGIQRFRRWGGILITLAFVSFLATEFLSGTLPSWPRTNVSIPHVKAADMCVHVAGAMAFLIVGLGVRKGWWMAPALGGFISGAIGNRGGAVACAAGIGCAFLLFPRLSKLRKVIPVAVVVLLGLTLLSILDIRIKLPSNRELSLDQLESNAESLLGHQSRADLNDTVQWRLRWWGRIIDYTFRGPYFWTGKGYGVNLTTSDGMAPNENVFPGLRSPHNSHLSILARSGVPGAALWVVLQLTWAVSVFRAYWVAKRQGKIVWAQTFGWLLAYWLAFTVNACFDVSLEGPVSAIPFWTVFGLGWGGCLRFSNGTKRRTHPARLRSQVQQVFEPSYVPLAPSP